MQKPHEDQTMVISEEEVATEEEEEEQELEKGDDEDISSGGDSPDPNDLPKEDSRLGALRLQKNSGNDLFKDGKYDDAYKEYEKGLRFFGVMFKEGDPLRPEAHLFKKDYHLNMALCCIRMKNFPDCKMHCDFVLGELEFPDDVKAHYRKGLANKNMGLFKEAEENFRKVLELEDESYSRRAVEMLSGMKTEDRVSKKKEKKIFGGMFDKGGAMEGIYDDKEDLSDLKKFDNDDVEDETPFYLRWKFMITAAVVVLVFVLVVAGVAFYFRTFLIAKGVYFYNIFKGRRKGGKFNTKKPKRHK